MDSFDLRSSMEASDFHSLAQALRGENLERRIEAMRALGKLGDGRAVPLLREQLGDGDVNVRRVAARVMYSMLADRASEVLDKDTIRHLLRFRAPEEILGSALGIRLFLETLEVVPTDSPVLDLEYGDGYVVSGTPMPDYRALKLRTSGIERDMDGTVRRLLAFFESVMTKADGWWTIGPMRGAGVVAFRTGDRFGETLHELAVVRISPGRYLTLTTQCRYADWD